MEKNRAKLQEQIQNGRKGTVRRTAQEQAQLVTADKYVPMILVMPWRLRRKKNLTNTGNRI